MLYRDICKALSFYLWILLLPLSIPLSIAIYCEVIVGKEIYSQLSCSFAFFLTLVCTLLLALVCGFIGRKSRGQLFRKEALLLVVLVYFLTPAIGALPFFLSHTLKSPLDAYFEAVSGITTTGATIMTAKKYDKAGNEIPIEKTFITGDKTTYRFYGTIERVFDPKTNDYLDGLDAVNPSLIFWRSFMQWLGGGGIIVLFVAILPALGVGGKVLFQTEMTGPSKESMLPRIKETASQLWKIYLALTIIQVILLVVTNPDMPLFDAVNISFSTISTGGFTPNNAGISGYQNAYTDWIVILFMILGSISFSLYFFCMRGKFSRLKDPELKVFLLIILLASLFATFQLMGSYENNTSPQPEKSYSFFEALRYGTFQIVSTQTSTGYSSANFDVWPFPIQVLLLILMFVGGMAGSTAGGIKVIRYQAFFRILLNKIESIYRPDTVRAYRIGYTQVDSPTAITILCFFMVAATLTIVGTFFLVLLKLDPETSLTTISSMTNNVGLAFRMGGPSESFAFLPVLGKILCVFWMIAGRLEYFALLILLVPSFWRTT